MTDCIENTFWIHKVFFLQNINATMRFNVVNQENAITALNHMPLFYHIIIQGQNIIKMLHAFKINKEQNLSYRNFLFKDYIILDST